MKAIRTLAALAVAARNLLLGGNLMSLGLLARPRRWLYYVNENLFFYRAYAGRHGLRQKNVFEVLPGPRVQSIVLGQLGGANPAREPWLHATTSYTADLVSLCLLCQILRPRVVFEIGTLRGYTAYHFALNTGPDTEIYTLDLPPDGSARPSLATTVMDEAIIGALNRRYSFSETPEAGKITCLYGDSAVFDYTPYHARVDLFFIDGSHSYEYVRSDTQQALACCHPGSVIAWHDFGRMGVNGVTRWLVELARERPVYAIPGGSLAFMVV
jgi:predicted O-methyltransferase YrrM